MSGIAGILNLDGSPVNPTDLERMAQAMAHRGPDGKRFWHVGPIGLAHLLLSVDPEPPQPLVRDGLALTLDGRIDYHRTLEQAEDQVDGEHAPHAVLAAYRQWGLEAPSALVGDFAFALWDVNHRRLMLARDAIGIKPLVYFQDAHRFIFASEARGILAVPGVTKRLNEAMVADYLLSDYHNPDATWFEGIRQVRPAHGLCVEGRRIRLFRHWDVNPSAQVSSQREEECFEQFRELFQEAVRCRLPRQSSAGVMLSGGIDSTLVTAMAETVKTQDGDGPPLIGFTVFCENFLQEEWEAIQRLVQNFGTHLHLIRPETPEGPFALFELFVSPVETLYRPGFITHPLVFGAVAAQGCRVLLTGEGGDELVGRSEWGVLEDLLRGCRFRSLIRAIRRMAWASRSPIWSLAMHLLRDQLPPRARWVLKTILLRQVPYWIEPGFAQRMRLAQRLMFRATRLFPTMCQEESYRVITEPAMALALNQIDGAVSRFTVECRHPYLDRRLIEFYLSVPSEIKAGPRKLFAQRALLGVTPGPLRDHEQGGYLIPPRDGQSDRAVDAERIEQMLASSDSPIFRYVSSSGVNRLLREYRDGNLTNRTPLYKLVSLQRWLEAFFPEEFTPGEDQVKQNERVLSQSVPVSSGGLT